MYCIVYMEVVIIFIQDAYEYVHVPAIVSDADVQKRSRSRRAESLDTSES